MNLISVTLSNEVASIIIFFSFFFEKQFRFYVTTLSNFFFLEMCLSQMVISLVFLRLCLPHKCSVLYKGSSISGSRLLLLRGNGSLPKFTYSNPVPTISLNMYDYLNEFVIYWQSPDNIGLYNNVHALLLLLLTYVWPFFDLLLPVYMWQSEEKIMDNVLYVSA